MPPNFPHAWFAPENALTIGGQIYTSGTLGRTIEALKMQEDAPDISDEELYDTAYSSLARILKDCHAVTTSTEKAQIISSCSLFPDPPDFTAAGRLSESDLIDMLLSHGIPVASGLKKAELVQLLEREGVNIENYSETPMELTQREIFLEAALAFCKKFAEGNL